MHEMGIASSVLDAVRTEAEMRPGARVTKVGLRVGELSGVDREALTFCLEAIVKGSDLEPLAFEIDYRPRQSRCPRCNATFAVVDYDVRCPSCGNEYTEPAGGDELELAYLEIEQ